MLALEGIRLTTLNLQVQVGGQIGDFLLHTTQANKTVKFLQTLRIVNCLWCLVWDILLSDGHQLFITHRRDALTLQALSLLLADLIEERTHGTTVSKILVTGVIHLRDNLFRQGLSLFGEDVFFVLGKDEHNLIE